jgi:uncharacterized membrane protein YqgA involved in biofilm formation
MLSSVMLKRDTSGSSIVEWNSCGGVLSVGIGFRLLSPALIDFAAIEVVYALHTYLLKSACETNYRDK